MNTQQIHALLPMKDHSERVPNKNLRNLAGKPLFFWVLESLLASKHVQVVYINTDSKKIAKEATENYDVKIIERPKELIGDDVSMNKIIGHDISQIKGNHFLQTHATNPMLKTSTIDRAIETYFTNTAFDSLFTVNKWQTRLYDTNMKPINHDPNVLLQTQDLPPVYEENSNLYIFSKGSFTKNDNKRIGKNPFLYKMNTLEAIDIDTEEDFKIAETIKLTKLENATDK